MVNFLDVADVVGGGNRPVVQLHAGAPELGLRCDERAMEDVSQTCSIEQLPFMFPHKCQFYTFDFVFGVMNAFTKTGQDIWTCSMIDLLTVEVSYDTFF